MFKLIGKPRSVKVTKAIIEEFTSMTPAPNDRPFKQVRFDSYLKFWKAGKFRPATWAKAYCKANETTYRVNGKHTSLMLRSFPKLPDYSVYIEEYECDTLEDVADLYSTFDSKMQTRSASDIYLAFAGTIPQIADFSPKIINAAISGMAYHTWQGNISSTQAVERAELVLEHPAFVVWLYKLMNGYLGSRKNMFRQAVIGAMFGCWFKVHSAATDFWSAVRDETGPTPNSPDRKLAHYLLTHGSDRGRGQSTLETASAREMYVKSIHAWNAWRTNKSTNLKYVAKDPVPRII